MPHVHTEDRIYTVISGVFYTGNTPHFHWAKSGEYVTQVTAYGPLGISYVEPKDDPRNQQP